MMELIVDNQDNIRIKIYYRKKKGKRYVINCKYIFPTEKDKLKILFRAFVYKTIRKESIYNFIPKRVLKELLKGL